MAGFCQIRNPPKFLGFTLWHKICISITKPDGENCMQILFRTKNDNVRDALAEMADDMDAKAFFAFSAEDAVRLMNQNRIDILFLEMRQVADAGLLKYANENFRDMRIVLIAGDDLKNMVSAIRKGRFSVLAEPYCLPEIKNIIAENNNERIMRDESSNR